MLHFDIKITEAPEAPVGAGAFSFAVFDSSVHFLLAFSVRKRS